MNSVSINGTLSNSDGSLFQGKVRLLPLSSNSRRYSSHMVVNGILQISSITPGEYGVQFIPSGKISPFQIQEKWQIPDKSYPLPLGEVRILEDTSLEKELQSAKTDVENRLQEIENKFNEYQSEYHERYEKQFEQEISDINVKINKYDQQLDHLNNRFFILKQQYKSDVDSIFDRVRNVEKKLIDSVKEEIEAIKERSETSKYVSQEEIDRINQKVDSLLEERNRVTQLEQELRERFKQVKDDLEKSINTVLSLIIQLRENSAAEFEYINQYLSAIEDTVDRKTNNIWEKLETVQDNKERISAIAQSVSGLEERMETVQDNKEQISAIAQSVSELQKNNPIQEKEIEEIKREILSHVESISQNGVREEIEAIKERSENGDYVSQDEINKINQKVDSLLEERDRVTHLEKKLKHQIESSKLEAKSNSEKILNVVSQNKEENLDRYRELSDSLSAIEDNVDRKTNNIWEKLEKVQDNKEQISAIAHSVSGLEERIETVQDNKEQINEIIETIENRIDKKMAENTQFLRHHLKQSILEEVKRSLHSEIINIIKGENR